MNRKERNEICTFHISCFKQVLLILLQKEHLCKDCINQVFESLQKPTPFIKKLINVTDDSIVFLYRRLRSQDFSCILQRAESIADYESDSNICSEYLILI